MNFMKKGVIRTMTEADIDSVVKIHQTAFRGFFLERMGLPFLAAYYNCVLNYRSSIALVYSVTGKSIDGFVVGFTDPVGFYESFRAGKTKLLLPIFLGLARRPWLLLEIFANVLRVTNKSETKIVDGSTELASIGVETPGHGIGGKLIRAFAEKAWAQSVRYITLTTDRDDNGQVHEFYTKHGFSNIGSERRQGRVLIKYLLENPIINKGEKV